MNRVHDAKIRFGAATSLIGYILSGPVAFLVVNLLHPQPPWESPATFAAHYNSIQDLPFYCGFILIGGMLMLSAAHYLNVNGNEGIKLQLLLSLGVTVVFCTLICFNYISQTTFIRHLALNYKPENDAIIATFSMSNPLSFCWANEMWGYGLLGIATWLMAGYYKAINLVIYSLLILNGVVSVVGVILTIIDINWLMSMAGLASYFGWNLLMITLMFLIYRHSTKEAQ